MSDPDHRACLNRLMMLSTEAERHEHHVVAAEVDRTLSCNGRRACDAHLACSWLAAELATHLAQRYR